MRRVVITGIGPVTVNGIGKDGYWNSLLNKSMVLSTIPGEFEKNYKFKSRFFVPKPELPQEGLSNLMEDSSRLAVVAAKLAVEDAELADCSDAGVILGIGMGSLKTGFTSYIAHTQGEGRFNRMGIPMLMPNSAAAWISIALGAEGFNYTVNAACASGNMAVGEAFLQIKNGRLDTVLTGGVECLDDGTGAIMRGFDMLTTLTAAGDGKPMPFSGNRSGFLFNMGAGCVLVLEEFEKAKNRGANIYAEIVDYAASSDAANIVQMLPSGEKIRELFNMAKSIEIDYINAHGTATVQNDQIEADIIKTVFGKHQPLVNSTKGILGHSIGASGALEAAAAALSLKTGYVHGNVTENVMEGLNIPIDTVKSDIKYALNASYGFGGHNSLLMLRRYET